jgi:hypothetical protein
MTGTQSFSRRARVHSRLAVIINTLAGGVVGAAFGSLGSFVPWLVGGLARGAALLGQR